ncbi:hypothetical protein CVT24_010081 [Panaeolus cyanescens]|uniref:Uncharacterized protein n=1 Tax=Panaeolus cyanescens TaxID=181874 RepID=A0A409YQ12_9AGAR|nr:hypothetical protein CVT24_010081 [Panaeolus cyanescens]
MMDTTEAIVANADYHSRLLAIISELEYVPTARRQQTSYVKDLQAQLDGIIARVAQLAEKTKKERKEHEALRDATAKRFAHKLMGKKEKFEAKESKEEREYVEALEREMTERDNQQVIQQMLDEAKRVLEDLKDKETKFESAKLELEALYGRVFDGPSEAFPEDDRLEYEMHEAQKSHDEAQARLNAESRAAELLARAARSMDACQQSVQEALGYSRYDMWGGGTMADMMERNALRNAQMQASQVEVLVDQAMRLSPNVKPVGRVNIAQGSIVSDMFFDNIFTDISFHSRKLFFMSESVLTRRHRQDQTVSCTSSLGQSTSWLKAERDDARRRVDSIGSQVLQVGKALDSRRKELHQFRRATFESFVAQNPPPPSYETAMTPTTTSNPPFVEPARTQSPAGIPSPTPGSADDQTTPMESLHQTVVPQWGSRKKTRFINF